MLCKDNSLEKKKKTRRKRSADNEEVNIGDQFGDDLFDKTSKA